MPKPTIAEYMKVLENNPTLCIRGMSDGLQKNFQANRKSLEVSYDAFLICCEWLTDQILNDRIEIFSLSSITLKHDIESHYGQFIPHGALLAATIFLGIDLNSGTDQVQQNQFAAAN